MGLFWVLKILYRQYGHLFFFLLYTKRWYHLWYSLTEVDVKHSYTCYLLKIAMCILSFPVLWRQYLNCALFIWERLPFMLSTEDSCMVLYLLLQMPLHVCLSKIAFYAIWLKTVLSPHQQFCLSPNPDDKFVPLFLLSSKDSIEICVCTCYWRHLCMFVCLLKIAF